MRVKAPHPHHMHHHKTDALRPLRGLGGLIMEKNNTHKLQLFPATKLSIL